MAEVIKISDWADDVATTTVKYRKHTIEFTFHPGEYTGVVSRDSMRLAEIIAACVTQWNIDCPLVVSEIEKLPAGAIEAVWAKLRILSLQADLPEADAPSPTG